MIVAPGPAPRSRVGNAVNMGVAKTFAVALAACVGLWAASTASAADGVAGCAGVAPQDERVADAETFVYAEGKRPLRIHVLQPAQGAGTHPAALFFFGGGWRLGQVSQFLGQAQALRDRGYVVALADYRVACRDGTSPLDAVADAAASYDWLLGRGGEFRIDRSRVVLAGGSAGGQLALMTALRAPAGARPAALVLFNPAVDLTGALARGATGLSDVQARAISPALLDTGALPPTIVFHGEDDRLVPIATVRSFCAKAPDCRLVGYRGEGHGFFNRRTVVETLGVSPYQATLNGMLGFLDDLSQP